MNVGKFMLLFGLVTIEDINSGYMVTLGRVIGPRT